MTRAAAQAEETCAALRARGASPVPMPTIAVSPREDLGELAEVLRRPSPGWLLVTSVNGVSALSRLLDEEPSLRTTLRSWSSAVVGPRTAEAFAALGLGDALLADEHRAEGLLARLPTSLAGQSAVLPGARKVRAALLEGLAERGAEVCHVPVYDNVLPAAEEWRGGLEALRAGQVDAALLTSGSTARNLHRILGDDAGALLGPVVLAAIGPVTARAVEALGWSVDVVADPYTVPALLDALAGHYLAKES